MRRHQLTAVVLARDIHGRSARLLGPAGPAGKRPHPARVTYRAGEVKNRDPYGNAVFLGVWRSLVARLLWEQDVGGSNPLTPTQEYARKGHTYRHQHMRQ